MSPGATQNVPRAFLTAERAHGRHKRQLNPATVALREASTTVTSQFETMTVRQVFYALTVLKAVLKTERGYQQVKRQVLAMRRDGTLAWSRIADATRWQRKPSSWDDVDDYLDAMARGYRRDLWQSQGVRIEVWLEKDALASVVVDVTRKWDVALMVSRGQSSATFLYEAAKAAERAWERSDAETYVYALYDHDAGGDRAARTIARDLPEHAPGVPIHFEPRRDPIADRQVEPAEPPSQENRPGSAEVGQQARGRTRRDSTEPPDRTRRSRDHRPHRRPPVGDRAGDRGRGARWLAASPRPPRLTSELALNRDRGSASPRFGRFGRCSHR